MEQGDLASVVNTESPRGVAMTHSRQKRGHAQIVCKGPVWGTGAEKGWVLRAERRKEMKSLSRTGVGGGEISEAT